MSKKLGVLILHGMGSQKEDYAKSMRKELVRRVRAEGADPDEIAWEPAFLAPVLQDKETQLWKDLSENRDLDFATLRKFFIHYFGDAIAYQRVEHDHFDVYTQIHDKMHEHLKILWSSVRASLSSDDPERPLVVIAHSLGSYMISNYIWDRQEEEKKQKKSKYGGNDFLEMKTLAGMVTFGSNIPLFSLAYDEFECITFPARQVHKYFPATTPREEIRSAAQWVNYYDRDDVLGYPLKPISASYRASAIRDEEINVGGILLSWNPGAHTGYWTDNDFTRPVAKQLAGLLKLL